MGWPYLCPGSSGSGRLLGDPIGLEQSGVVFMLQKASLNSLPGKNSFPALQAEVAGPPDAGNTGA